MITIRNVQILDHKALYKEIKDDVLNTSSFILAIISNKQTTINEYVYSILERSKNISFDSDYIEDVKKEIPLRSELNSDNMIETKCGLTQAEMWFNSLSEEHKIYVKDLSDTVFNSIAMAQ